MLDRALPTGGLEDLAKITLLSQNGNTLTISSLFQANMMATFENATTKAPEQLIEPAVLSGKPPPFDPSLLQAGAIQMTTFRAAESLPGVFRTAGDVLQTPQGRVAELITPEERAKLRSVPYGSRRTPDEMEAVNYFTDQVRSFRGSDGKGLDEAGQDALYRTLMDRYCVDDYSPYRERDLDILRHAGVTDSQIDKILENATKNAIPGGRKCAIA